MAPRWFALLLVFVLGLLPGLQAQPSSYYLKDGDVVAFYGDSITEQRLYTLFVETFTLLRYPNLNIRYYNAGWGGDRVSGGSGGRVDERLRRDVLAYKPTVMTVMLGMNDGRYRAFDQPLFDEYSKGLESIVDTVTTARPDLRITMIRPSPYDDVTVPPTFEGGYNQVLVKYGDFVEELAKRKKHHIADLNAPVVGWLKRANEIDPKRARMLIEDRIHPASGGHLLMAAALLKAWGANPVVSIVEIDGKAGTVTRQEKTEVTGMKNQGTLSWTQLDQSLPFPSDFKNRSGIPNALWRQAAGVDLAVQASDFYENFNQQRLRVVNLADGNYTLSINGMKVGSFTAKQLNDGLNLAALPTPMFRQAEGVLSLTQKRSNLQHLRWRQIQMDLRPEGLARLDSIVSNLDALESELIAKQQAASKPAKSFYELVRE